MLKIEEFKKLEIRIGKILTAEKIPNTDLLKLTIDVGKEKIQTVAGAAKCYGEKEIVGKSVVVLTNLEPKIIRGIESRGMILAAGESKESIVLLVPEIEVPPGTKVM